MTNATPHSERVFICYSLLAFATLNPVRFPAPVVVLLAVISTLIGLLVKGAIAAFYLRHAALPTTGGEAQLRA